MRCMKLTPKSLNTCSELCQEKCLTISGIPLSSLINSLKKNSILSRRVFTRTKTERSLLLKRKLNLLRTTTREAKRTTRMERNSSTRTTESTKEKRTTKVKRTIKARKLTKTVDVTARRMV